MERAPSAEVPPKSAPAGDLASLQAARGLAALLVVYLHAAHEARSVLAQGVQPPIFGASGVDVFFCLSGLVLWRAVKRSSEGPGAFCRRRWKRVAPLYWLFTLLAALIGLDAPGIAPWTGAQIKHLLASLAFVPWINPTLRLADAPMTPLLPPGWTLNYEMMFYLLLGASLLVGPARRLRALVAIFAAALAARLALGASSEIAAFYDPWLVGEFLMGVVVAEALERAPCAWPGGDWALGAGAVALMLTCEAMRAPVHRVIYAGVPAAVLLYLVASREIAGRWPRLPLAERLGDASYSLYLSHLLVMSSLAPHVAPWLAGRLGAWDRFGFVALVGAASVAVGLAVHVGVERPLLSLGRRPLRLTAARPALAPARV